MGLPITFLKKVSFDSGAKSSGGREDPESSAPQRRNSLEASSGDFLDLKVSVAIREEDRLQGYFSLEIRSPPPPVLLRASVLPPSFHRGCWEKDWAVLVMDD